MKVVIVDTTVQGPLIGGAQTFLPDFLKGLVNNNHEVHLLAVGQLDSKVASQILASGAYVHSNLVKKNQLPSDSALILAKWVNNLDPDIYLISVSPDIGWLALPYLSPSIATLAIGHSNADAFYLPAEHYRSFISGVVGVSDEICTKYHSIGGIKKNLIHWIPYGIHPSASLPERKGKEVLNLIFVGRLEEGDKRISDVAEIVKRLDENGHSFHFRIVGDGSRLEMLQKVLQPQIEKGKVELTGWKNRDEVLLYLQQTDIFILTSSSEGFSISLVEAMANGCCPVVTDIPSGSIQLIKDDINGYLVNVGDIDSFVKIIIALDKDRIHLQTLRNNAWKTGREYSIEKMVTNYEQVFKASIEESKKNPRKMDFSYPVMPSCRSKYPKWLRRLKVYALDIGLVKTKQ